MKKIHISNEERFVIEINCRMQTEDFSVGKYISAAELILRLKEYLAIKDITENTKHANTFANLYLHNQNVTNSSLTKIMQNTFLPESTLGRYRKYYKKLIKYFIKRYSVFFITVKK